MKYFCGAKLFWLGLGLDFQASKGSLGGAEAVSEQNLVRLGQVVRSI